MKSFMVHSSSKKQQLHGGVYIYSAIDMPCCTSFPCQIARELLSWPIEEYRCLRHSDQQLRQRSQKWSTQNQCKLSYQYLLGNSRLTLHDPNLKLLEFAWCWRIPGHHCHQMILASCIRRPSRLKLCPWSAGHLADHRLGPCLHIVSPSDKPQSQMRKLYHLCRLKQDVSVACPWIALNTHRWAYTFTFPLWPCHVWRWEVLKAQRSSGRAVVYLRVPPKNGETPGTRNKVPFLTKVWTKALSNIIGARTRLQVLQCTNLSANDGRSCEVLIISRESKNTSL